MRLLALWKSWLPMKAVVYTGPLVFLSLTVGVRCYYNNALIANTIAAAFGQMHVAAILCQAKIHYMLPNGG